MDFGAHVPKKIGHETDLEMSPRPLGTTVFEEIYIRTMGKQSQSSEINLRLVYSHFYDHVDHHIFQLITAFHLFHWGPPRGAVEEETSGGRAEDTFDHTFYISNGMQ